MVARTVEVVRAVVNIKAPSKVEVEVKLPETEEKSAKKGRRTLTESLFFEELAENKGEAVADQVSALIDELIDLGLQLEPRKSSVSLRLPDPSDTGQAFTALVIRTSGRTNVVSATNIHRKGGYDPQTALQYLEGFSDMAGAAIGETADSTEQVDVEIILSQKDELLSLVREFKNALEAEAAERD